MEKEKDDGKTKGRFLPGQVFLFEELSGLAAREKKRKACSSAELEDLAFLFGPPGEEKEGPEDGGDWPLGDV